MAVMDISQQPKEGGEREESQRSSDNLKGGGSRCVTTPLTTPLRGGKVQEFCVK